MWQRAKIRLDGRVENAPYRELEDLALKWCAGDDFTAEESLQFDQLKEKLTCDTIRDAVAICATVDGAADSHVTQA
ncbi:hypothetical protein TruAng_001968 [Truncatella angustata]|nr:hypothetical protein TruAng_001968 [Truncatella angustata]